MSFRIFGDLCSDVTAKGFLYGADLIYKFVVAYTIHKLLPEIHSPNVFAAASGGINRRISGNV